jgi:hypothetical protein
MITSKHLTAMGVRHTLVVEPAELDAYLHAAQGLLADVIPLDMSYKDKYEMCDGWDCPESGEIGPTAI